MNIITEYLKLIPKGLQNPLEVIQGVINAVKMRHGTLPQDEQNEIVRRRLICESCPFVSSRAVNSPEYADIFGKRYETDRPELHCSACGCPVESKTSSLGSECGLSSNEKTKHLPLKWTKYKRNEI